MMLAELRVSEVVYLYVTLPVFVVLIFSFSRGCQNSGLFFLCVYTCGFLYRIIVLDASCNSTCTNE